ncbi:MAG: AAA family ATPase [Robiginitomaculum sp.]|nr:AAA family ATPase [Robiginitomaculum sp.]
MDDKLSNNVLELRQIVEANLEIPAPADDKPDAPETKTSKFTPKSAEPEEPEEAKIWAYLGVVGGAGVTSLAVQSAWELSTSEVDGEKARVLLVDLDFERGDCAAYLDMETSISIAELNETDGRMDENLAATFIRRVSPSLSLLSAEAEIGGNDLLSTNALLSLLDSVSGLFDYIILDVPPMWRAWTQAVIGAADKFALVTEARVPALHLTRKIAEDIREAMSLPALPDIILNKHERRSLSGGLSLGDVHKVLRRDSCSQIVVDDETLRIAINTGKPAGVLKPKSRYTKSVRAHVRTWRNLEANPPAKAAPRRRDRRAARS